MERAKFGPTSVLLNKVLLEQNHTHFYVFIYGCCHATKAELSRGKKLYGLQT